MPNRHNISRNTESLPEDRAARYRSIVGAINYYATALRYDIAYPASRLSQFSVHPTVGAEMALHRVLSYLKCTSDFSISAARTVADDLECYSDSDHA